MARRKRQLMEDDDSDSSENTENAADFDDMNDPDAREERALFEDPYQRKRRRKNHKEDALYGIFGEDSDNEGTSRRAAKGGSGKEATRSDWTKAPAFVSGEDTGKSVSMEEEDEPDVGGDGDDNSDGGESAESDGEQVAEDGFDEGPDISRPPSPRVREEEGEMEEPQVVKPRVGGIGFSSSKSRIEGTFGSSAPAMSSSQAMPTSFGGARKQQSFVREGRSPAVKPAAPLSANDRAHFGKLQGSFGARMLEKMGWQAGTGLGTTGEGIVTPVESKMRPQKMGIAFKGFKEKTEQSKAEARRRGEIVSDEEDEVRPKKKGGKSSAAQEKKSDAWKKPKKVKTKIEHKTYEQIIAEAGEDVQVHSLGKIIDATGAIPREVASLADISSWTPSTDPTRIPEVRHNLRLINDACKSDLDGLAREAKTMDERKKWIINEDARLRKKVDEEAELISRLQQVHLLADEISSQAKESASIYEASLEPFQPHFYKLLAQFSQEYDRYRLDEIVVAAIAPLVRRMVAQWNPLEDPSNLISTFKTWRPAFKMNIVPEGPGLGIDIYGATAPTPRETQSEQIMTPFESLLWNVWLPKVRSCINNDWSPNDPQPAVKLYEVWSTFLPPFIKDNLLDQLILPKVRSAVADWNPRKHNAPLQALIFPWLPHLGLRLEDVVGDGRRRLKSVLKSWTVDDNLPDDLQDWRDVFDSNDWDAMLLKYVVPKLGAMLRNDFRINPRKQNMEPLQRVLLWTELLRPSILAQLLETEFFPKWLDVLHIWLIQPNVSFEEVAQWYAFWKDSFPESVHSIPGVAQGFTRGLQLMNKAIELGPDAPANLPRPNLQFAPEITPAPKSRGRDGKPHPARVHEITFRSIVEEFAASHNLLFVPTGRAHETSRMPLFRVSPTADGRKGLLVYILDDAVWAPDGDIYRAITLEDMVLRAATAA